MKKYILPAIFVFAVIMRLVELGTATFWYDEVFTASISRLPFSQMMTAIMGDVHPPLYYILTWCMVHLGLSSEAALRFPSVVLSMLALYLLYRLTVKLKLPQSVQLASLAFMVLSSFQEYFSQEARMYALLQVEILLMVLFVLNRKYILFGIMSLAALYTQNYAVFYVPIIGLIGFAEEMKAPVIVSDCIEGIANSTDNMIYPGGAAKLRLSLASIVVPLVLWIPWLFVMKGQMHTIGNAFWIQPTTPGSALYSIYMLFFGDSQLEAFRSISAMVTAGALTFCIIRGIQKRRIMFLWLSLAPLAAAILAGYVWQPLLLYRGLIGSAPFLYLLVASELAPKRWSYRLASLAIFLPVTISGLAGYYLYNPINKGNDILTIAMVRDQWQPGDLIYHVSDNSALFWSYYGRDMPQFEMPSCGVDLGSLSDPTRKAIGIQQVAFDKLPAHSRLWIIWGASATSTQCEDTAARALIAGAQQISMKDFYGLAFQGVYLDDPSNEQTQDH